MGPKKGAKAWDTALLGLYGVAMMIMWIVAGLDLRYGWSSGISPSAQILALLIVIAGYALVVWATGTNAFFSQVVPSRQSADIPSSAAGLIGLCDIRLTWG